MELNIRPSTVDDAFQFPCITLLWAPLNLGQIQGRTQEKWEVWLLS